MRGMKVSIKVLFCGGQKDGETRFVQSGHAEVRFAVPSKNYFPLIPDTSPSVDSCFETVKYHIHLQPIQLPSGNECTLAVAVMDGTWENMSITEWLAMLSKAADAGCGF
jgi:hypothetical protein